MTPRRVDELCILQIEKYLDSQQQNDAVSNQPDVKDEAAEDHSDDADEEEEVQEEVKCAVQADPCIMSTFDIPPRDSAVVCYIKPPKLIHALSMQLA